MSRVFGTLKAAQHMNLCTFNVQNLFDLISEPGKRDFDTMPSPQELEVKLEKLSFAVMNELECPEVLVVQEIDNEAVLQELGNRVNASAGTYYSAVSYPTSDERSIEVGFLYDESRIKLLDSFQLNGPAVERAFGLSSPSPGREPIVGKFDVRGYELIVIGNHFKSKGGFVFNESERLEIERATEEQRREQALALRRYVKALFSNNLRVLLAVAGDFNDFRWKEPRTLD
jgi:predicted extracellular nuclease